MRLNDVTYDITILNKNFISNFNIMSILFIKLIKNIIAYIYFIRWYYERFF